MSENLAIWRNFDASLHDFDTTLYSKTPRTSDYASNLFSDHFFLQSVLLSWMYGAFTLNCSLGLIYINCNYLKMSLLSGAT